MGRLGRMVLLGLISIMSMLVASGCRSSPTASPTCLHEDGTTVCMKYLHVRVAFGESGGPPVFLLSARGLQPGSDLFYSDQPLTTSPVKADSIGVADVNGAYPPPDGKSGYCTSTDQCSFGVSPFRSPQTVFITVTSRSGVTVTGSFVLKAKLFQPSTP
ncbi:MAG: hypothetical protein QOF30_458 [Acidimicrobiaceae bacterium]|nr:hypothetical protein [Acidimicrobiaceae bacterium]